MDKPKFSTALLMILGALLLLPILASAAPSITETSVKLTADYSKFADEDDDFIVVTTESFTVNNTDGTEDAVVKVTGLPAGYAVQSVITVLKNTTAPVTLAIEVPHDKLPGTEKIGTIELRDSENKLLDSADLNQETLSLLELTELEVKYVSSTGKTEKDEFNSEGLTYKLENEVKPFTEITFIFDLQNLFDKDYQRDGKLEEIELTVDVDDTGLLEDGFEDRYSFDDLEAGKSNKYPVTLMINEEVEPDTYTLEFTITAEDGEGIEYEINKEVELEIELDDDDVRIVKAVISEAAIAACDKETSLDVEVHNFGSDDQNDVRVALSNPELGLDEKVENIAIDGHTEKGDSWQKNFLVPLADAEEKIYFLDLKTYLGNTITDAETIQLEVKPCAAEPVVEKEEQTPEPSATAAEPETAEEEEEGKNTITGNIIKSVEKISYTSNDYLIALMLITIAAVGALIVLMLVILFKDNK